MQSPHKDVGDNRLDSTQSNSIITTWHISFEHIRKVRPTAAELLPLMSLFNRQGIPELLLCNQYHDGSEVDFDDDIHTLANFSLIKMNARGRVFDMHRLVQFSTGKWLELHNDLEHWKGKFIETLFLSWSKITDTLEFENWAMGEAPFHFPHFVEMLGYRPKDSDVKNLELRCVVVNQGARYVNWKGEYTIAMDMIRQVLEARETLHGKYDLRTLREVRCLGIILSGLALANDADFLDELFRAKISGRAQGGNQKASGETNRDTFETPSKSLLSLTEKWAHEGAEQVFQEALERNRRALGEEHPDIVETLHLLASHLRSEEKYAKAEPLYRLVLEQRAKALGREHPDTLKIVFKLCDILVA